MAQSSATTLGCHHFLQIHLTASPTAPVAPKQSSSSYSVFWAKWESSSVVNNIFSCRTLLLKVVDLRRWKNDMNFNLSSRIPAHLKSSSGSCFTHLISIAKLFSFHLSTLGFCTKTEKAQLLVDWRTDTHHCVMSKLLYNPLLAVSSGSISLIKSWLVYTSVHDS